MQGAGHEVCVAMCGRDCVQQSQTQRHTHRLVPPPALPSLFLPCSCPTAKVQVCSTQAQTAREEDAAEVLLDSRVLLLLLLLLLLVVEWSSSSPEDQHQDQLVCVNWTNVPLCVDVLTSKCRKNDTNCSTLFEDSKRERERETVSGRETANASSAVTAYRKKVMQLLSFFPSTFSRYLKKSKQLRESSKHTRLSEKAEL